MIEYSKTGKPSVINYNVPEPTSYRGRNIIKLEYDKSIFIDHEGEQVVSGTQEDFNKVLEKAENVSLKRSLNKKNTSLNEKLLTINPKTKELGKGVLINEIKNGKIPVITHSINGTPSVKFAPNPKRIEPAIYIVETYVLSNFLGDYGAGKVINTFSLLPGEKTKISIKSYRSSTSTSKESSSIFDSYTTETEDSFEESVQSENTDKQMQEETFNYHVEAEAEAKWGWGKAKVSGGVSGSVNSSRETFSKNMNSSTNKHANKASAKRDITINSSSETTTNEGEESVIERVIENINSDRTLNFVFRQMNQQFISVLHLVDIKLCYYNGYEDTKREVQISDIDSLLIYCIKEENNRKKIKNDIYNSLTNIIDFNGNIHDDFIIKKDISEEDGTKNSFWFINRNKTTTLEDINKTVEGIVLLKTQNVLRTDGIIVEALIGQSDAHSPFTSHEKTQNILLKEASQKSILLKNQLMELFINSLKEGNEALTKNILTYFDKTKIEEEN